MSRRRTGTIHFLDLSLFSNLKAPEALAFTGRCFKPSENEHRKEMAPWHQHALCPVLLGAVQGVGVTGDLSKLVGCFFSIFRESITMTDHLRYHVTS
jgi:hypothetical protein